MLLPFPTGGQRALPRSEREEGSWCFVYECLIVEPVKAETKSPVYAGVRRYLHTFTLSCIIACMYSHLHVYLRASARPA